MPLRKTSLDPKQKKLTDMLAAVPDSGPDEMDDLPSTSKNALAKLYANKKATSFNTASKIDKKLNDTPAESQRHLCETKNKPLKKQFNYPVTLKTFQQCTYYEELIDQIQQKYAGGNEVEYQRKRQNKKLRSAILQKFYHKFYKHPSIREKYKLRLKPCPSKIRAKIFEIPCADANDDSEVVVNDANQVSVVPTATCSRKIVDTEAPQEQNVSNLQFQDVMEPIPIQHERHTVQSEKIKLLTSPATNSKMFDYPVTFEDFKKYSFYEDTIDDIQWELSKGDKAKFQRKKRNKEMRAQLLEKYYHKFYKHPNVRNKYKLRLKPCPKKIHDTIMKIPSLGEVADDDEIEHTQIENVESESVNEDCQSTTEKVVDIADPTHNELSPKQSAPLETASKPPSPPSVLQITSDKNLEDKTLNTNNIKTDVKLEFPVSQKLFTKYIKCNEIVDQILKDCAMGNEAEFQQLKQNEKMRARVLRNYYQAFYLKPSIRDKYKFSLYPCPAKIQAKILQKYEAKEEMANTINNEVEDKGSKGNQIISTPLREPLRQTVTLQKTPPSLHTQKINNTDSVVQKLHKGTKEMQDRNKSDTPSLPLCEPSGQAVTLQKMLPMIQSEFNADSVSRKLNKEQDLKETENISNSDIAPLPLPVTSEQKTLQKTLPRLHTEQIQPRKMSKSINQQFDTSKCSENLLSPKTKVQLTSNADEVLNANVNVIETSKAVSSQVAVYDNTKHPIAHVSVTRTTQKRFSKEVENYDSEPPNKRNKIMQRKTCQDILQPSNSSSVIEVPEAPEALATEIESFLVQLDSKPSPNGNINEADFNEFTANTNILDVIKMELKRVHPLTFQLYINDICIRKIAQKFYINYITDQQWRDLYVPNDFMVKYKYLQRILEIQKNFEQTLEPLESVEGIVKSANVTTAKIRIQANKSILLTDSNLLKRIACKINDSQKQLEILQRIKNELTKDEPVKSKPKVKILSVETLQTATAVPQQEQEIYADLTKLISIKHKKALDLFFQNTEKCYSLPYVIATSRGVKQRILCAILEMTFEEFSQYTRIHDAQEIFTDCTTLKSCYNFAIVRPQIWPINLYIRLSDLRLYLQSKGINVKPLKLKNISPKLLHWEDLISETNYDECVVLDYFETTLEAEIKSEEMLKVRRECYYIKCWSHEKWLWQEPVIISYAHLAHPIDDDGAQLADEGEPLTKCPLLRKVLESHSLQENTTLNSNEYSDVILVSSEDDDRNIDPYVQDLDSIETQRLKSSKTEENINNSEQNAHAMLSDVEFAQLECSLSKITSTQIDENSNDRIKNTNFTDTIPQCSSLKPSCAKALTLPASPNMLTSKSGSSAATPSLPPLPLPSELPQKDIPIDVGDNFIAIMNTQNQIEMLCEEHNISTVDPLLAEHSYSSQNIFDDKQAKEYVTPTKEEIQEKLSKMNNLQIDLNDTEVENIHPVLIEPQTCVTPTKEDIQEQLKRMSNLQFVLSDDEDEQLHCFSKEDSIIEVDVDDETAEFENLTTALMCINRESFSHSPALSMPSVVGVVDEQCEGQFIAAQRLPSSMEDMETAAAQIVKPQIKKIPGSKTKAANTKSTTDTVPQRTHEFRALPLQKVTKTCTVSKPTPTVCSQTSSSSTPNDSNLIKSVSVSQALATDSTFFNSTQLLHAVDQNVRPSKSSAQNLRTQNAKTSSILPTAKASDKNSSCTSTSALISGQVNVFKTNQLHRTMLHRKLLKFHYFDELSAEHIVRHHLPSITIGQRYMQTHVKSAGQITKLYGANSLSALLPHCSHGILSDMFTVLNDLKEYHYHMSKRPSKDAVSDLRERVLYYFLHSAPSFSYCHLQLDCVSGEYGRCEPIAPHTNESVKRRPHRPISEAIKPTILARIASLKSIQK